MIGEHDCMLDEVRLAYRSPSGFEEVPTVVAAEPPYTVETPNFREFGEGKQWRCRVAPDGGWRIGEYSIRYPGPNDQVARSFKVRGPVAVPGRLGSLELVAEGTTTVTEVDEIHMVDTGASYAELALKFDSMIQGWLDVVVLDFEVGGAVKSKTIALQPGGRYRIETLCNPRLRRSVLALEPGEHRVRFIAQFGGAIAPLATPSLTISLPCSPLHKAWWISLYHHRSTLLAWVVGLVLLAPVALLMALIRRRRTRAR